MKDIEIHRCEHCSQYQEPKVECPFCGPPYYLSVDETENKMYCKNCSTIKVKIKWIDRDDIQL